MPPQERPDDPESQEWKCPECAKRRNIVVRATVVRLVIGPWLAGDRITGGKAVYCCWHCLLVGRTVVAGDA